MSKIKYPRTYHLPWSLGVQSDDKIIKSLDQFIGREIVVTEKLDGENTSFYNDHMHARSLDSCHNVTRDWCKKLQACLANDIPEFWRLCGENVNYEHSLRYEDLVSFFYLFSIWNEKNMCLSWDETLDWADILDLATPKVFYRGVWDEERLRELAKNLDTNVIEGYVVRVVDGFHRDEFPLLATKFVREGHVQPDSKHWLVDTKPNKLHDGIIKPHYMK
jgi:ATP-dependent RNA circularization protein (DNA/RNA ligase family)